MTCQTKCAPFNPFHTDYLTNAFYLGGGRCDVIPYVVRTFVFLNTQAIQRALRLFPYSNVIEHGQLRRIHYFTHNCVVPLRSYFAFLFVLSLAFCQIFDAMLFTKGIP